VPALDGLRAAAVLLVVAYHTSALVNPFTMKATNVGFIDAAMGGGFLGVDVFFVLSGFLITALLLREVDRGGVSFRGFYWRRGWRLLPALAVMLFAHLIYAIIVGLPLHQEAVSIVAAFTYTYNYVAVIRPRSLAPELGHLWSLAVEEQFYLIWPLALVLMLRRRSQWLVPFVLVIGIVVVALNRVWVFQHSHGGYIRTDTRADALLIGALLAWTWTRGLIPKVDPKPAAWLAVIGMVAIIEMSTNRQSTILHVGGFTVFAAGVAVVIFAILESNWGAVLRWRPLRGVGRVSYALYLWNGVIFAAILRQGHPRWVWSRLALAYGLTALVTWLSWVLIERRAIAFGHKNAPNRPQRPDADEVGPAGIEPATEGL
jgi:peptidoglycan/LPS O-acetylase OafA/YrhL